QRHQRAAFRCQSGQSMGPCLQPAGLCLDLESGLIDFHALRRQWRAHAAVYRRAGFHRHRARQLRGRAAHRHRLQSNHPVRDQLGRRLGTGAVPVCDPRWKHRRVGADGQSNSAVIAYDGGASGNSYTGLTMAQDGSGNHFLYAADFKNGKVDVFNASFVPTQVGGAFFDASVPQGYAPYGIQNIPASDGSARIYVAYAQPVSTSQHVAMGAGLGYLAVFDAQGTLITHLVSQGALNAPWGLALAPANFGPLSGALLVGNFGDGAINAYNPTTGASMGPLMLTSSQQLFISGLWSLQFGNGVSGSSQPTNTLFFTAGPNGEAAGQYGRIDMTGTYTPPSNGGGSMGY